MMVDVLQSEQGARFLGKRNRNIVIRFGEGVPVHDDSCWLTLGKIQVLLRQDNIRQYGCEGGFVVFAFRGRLY